MIFYFQVNISFYLLPTFSTFRCSLSSSFFSSFLALILSSFSLILISISISNYLKTSLFLLLSSFLSFSFLFPFLLHLLLFTASLLLFPPSFFLSFLPSLIFHTPSLPSFCLFTHSIFTSLPGQIHLCILANRSIPLFPWLPIDLELENYRKAAARIRSVPPTAPIQPRLFFFLLQK